MFLCLYRFVELKHSETAGVMMALFLSAGLAIGSVVSVLISKIIWDLPNEH